MASGFFFAPALGDFAQHARSFSFRFLGHVQRLHPRTSWANLVPSLVPEADAECLSAPQPLPDTAGARRETPPAAALQRCT